LFVYYPFSGGLDTKFQEIKPIIAPGIVMATVGVILTALFTGLFVWFKFGHLFSAVGAGLFTCFLLAATVSSTDSASVFGILRSRGLNLKNNLRPLLEFESGGNDPMALYAYDCVDEYHSVGGFIRVSFQS